MKEYPDTIYLTPGRGVPGPLVFRPMTNPALGLAMTQATQNFVDAARAGDVEGAHSALDQVNMARRALGISDLLVGISDAEIARQVDHGSHSVFQPPHDDDGNFLPLTFATPPYDGAAIAQNVFWTYVGANQIFSGPPHLFVSQPLAQEARA